MRKFIAYSLVAITLLAIFFTSCDKRSDINSYPKWEFNITVDGHQSHFKSNNNQLSASWATAAVFSGTYSVSLNGNSISDPEWVSGISASITIGFDEKLGQQNATIFWNPSTGIVYGNILIDINELGSAPINNSGTTQWGKMLEVSIPQQTFSEGNVTHTISGTFKAVRQN